MTPVPTCGTCERPSGCCHLRFECALPPEPGRGALRARAVILNVELCETCGPRTLKHLKRIFPNRLFRTE